MSAGKQNTMQLLSRDWSLYSVETFDVRGGEQCWASTTSVALLVGLARCLIASGLRQFLDKQFVLSLRALPYHVSTWTETRPCWKTAIDLGLMANLCNFKAITIKRLPLNNPGKVRQGCTSHLLVGTWVCGGWGASNFNRVFCQLI